MSRSAVGTMLGDFFHSHPEEAARALEALSLAQILSVLEPRDPSVWARVFECLTPLTAAQILTRVDPGKAGEILNRSSATSSALALSQLEAENRKKILSMADAAVARDVDLLLHYPPGTAGQMMDPRFPRFRGDLSAQKALAQIRKDPERRITDLFIVDGQERMTGMLSLEEVALARPSQLLSELPVAASASVHPMTTQEETLELFEKNRRLALPVVDAEGKFLGAIGQERLVSAVQEEASTDIQTMVGVSREERAFSSPFFVVKKRLPWLEINLLTAFIAASVVGFFEGTIARFTALAVLLPVVAGQSGNTGAQAMAVTMRGLVLREIRLRSWPRLLFKEGKVGLMNGLAIALTTSLGVYLWSRSLGLALVTGVSMVLSMVAAGLSGATVPMLLTLLRQDPAQSSSIILTTITDVVGFSSFLGLATILSGLLK